MRKIALVVSAFVMMLSFSFTAIAGTWKNDEQGWWYVNDDGSFAASGWQLIEGVEYYFDEQGYLLVNTVTPDGFQVDAEGKKVLQAAAHSEEVKSNSTGSSAASDGVYYWTPGGKSYHTTSGCRSLSRSRTINKGSLTEAKSAGKTDPCNNCVK